MDELLLKEETLSTSDIAHPERARSDWRNDSPVAMVDVNNQPGTQPATVEAQSTAYSAGAHEGPLFADHELNSFRTRWDQVQTSFVDEPRQAVQQADSLVANVVQRIAEQFAQEREQLERQWDSGTNVSTEELRQAFKRYRAFFGRLLAF